MKRYVKKYLPLLGLLLLVPIHAEAQMVISQVTTWKKDVDASRLFIPDEAGSDLTSVIESSANYNQLDILNMASTQGWKITVSKQDMNWPPTLTPYVKRTGNGSPCASCSGINQAVSVNGYLPVTNMEQDFIFGTGEVSNVDVQFKVDGLSLALDADNYSTEIIYTIYGD